MDEMSKHLLFFPTIFAFVAVTSGCQTSGSDGILSSVLPGNAQKESTTTTPASAPVIPGENPNANRRLANTRTALSDYCPAVRLRAGTENYRTYPKGADKENQDNIEYQATITSVARECRYEGQQLFIKVGARGRVITGPKGSSGQVNVPIRVAVTRGDETIYSKLHRPLNTIPSGRSYTQFTFVDDQVIIPAPKALNLRVLLGFDEGPYNTP